MNTRQQFKRAVIEAIHGKPYEEAIEKETRLVWEDDVFKRGAWSEVKHLIKDEELKYTHPITIGRVMQALENKRITHHYINNAIWHKEDEEDDKMEFAIKWKLTKENGQECDDDDQTDETIKKLLALIK